MGRIFEVGVVVAGLCIGGCRFGYEVIDDELLEESSEQRAHSGGQGGTATNDVETHSGSWGKVERLDLFTEDDDDDDDDWDSNPSFTNDRLELYFSSTRGDSDEQLFVTTRLSPDVAWAAPTPVDELNSGLVTTMPAVSSNGLTLYFVREPGDLSSSELYVSTRSERNQPWGEPALVGCSDAGRVDHDPTSAVDGLFLVWVQHDESETERLVFSSRQSTNDAWSTLSQLDSVNSEENDAEPWISDSRLHLFFSSERRGDSTLYESHRASINDTFSEPERINDLDRAGLEQAPWLDQSLSYMVFAADWDGTMRLYETNR